MKCGIKAMLQVSTQTIAMLNAKKKHFSTNSLAGDAKKNLLPIILNVSVKLLHGHGIKIT